MTSNNRNSLAKKEKLIDRHSLDRRNYLLSLLQTAVQQGFMTAQTADEIKQQALALLPAAIDGYTVGMSSSVPEAAAQSLMQSVLYSIDFALVRQQSPEVCLELIADSPLKEMFEEGQKLIERQVKNVRGLLTCARQSRLDTGNIAYNSTLDEGLPLFFKEYDPQFAAHETPGSIDYPLFSDDAYSSGIGYLQQYLKKLSSENRFCSKFSSEDIRTLCKSYDNGFDNLLINIFDLVLTNALGCALLKKGTGSLLLTQAELDRLQKLLASGQCAQLLRRAGERISRSAKPMGRFDLSYLTQAIVTATTKIRIAVRTGKELPFVIEQPQPESSAMVFEDGVKMPDETFRSLTEELRGCRNFDDKLALIRSEFHSMADLTDMLSAGCLFDQEYASFYATLGPSELALLCKALPQTEKGELCCGSPYSAEEENEWQRRLIDYLSSLGSVRSEAIMRMAKGITL